MPELAGRRERACREYIIDLDQRKAYVRAGYTGDPQFGAYRLFAEPVMVERVAELAAERNKELKLDANDIIIELLRMLTSDPLNYVDEEGRVLSLAEMSVDARRAIASFEVDTIGTTNAVTRTRVKFWNKEKAAELLGKHLTMFKDVLSVEGLEDIANLIIAARARVPLELPASGRVIEHVRDLTDDELV